MNIIALSEDIARLDALYAGRQIRYGEMHAHANTGGHSDGKFTLPQWKEKMETCGVDFSTIVDHKQTTHMGLPEWDSSMFIGGSEAGGSIKDSPATQKMLHYNMLFATVEEFENLLNMYPEKFHYADGEFRYCGWTVEEIHQFSRDVYACGGLLGHVHPKYSEYLKSDDPLDYFYGDVMLFEVFTGYYDDMIRPENMEQYKTWTQLLALGKRVFAGCGSDAHGSLNSVTLSLGTIYTENKDAGEYLGYMRQGNFTAGPVGIRMAVGDTQMGGEGSFDGQRLVISAGQIHYMTYDKSYTYRLDLYDDKGLVFSEEISGKEPAYFAMDANPEAKYYHANVYDVTRDRIIGIGNPIWNIKEEAK